VVDINHRHPDGVDELPGQDLHVPGEDDKVHVAAQQPQLLLLRLPFVGSYRDVQEGDRELPDVLGQVGMVGDDAGDAHVELAATVPPQQVEHAVVGLGREDGYAFLFRRLVQPEPEAEPLSDLSLEGILKVRPAGCQVGQVEDRPLEEVAAAGVRRVLVQRQDVGSPRGQHGRHCRDDPGAVLSLNEQAPDVRVATCAGRRPEAFLLRYSAHGLPAPQRCVSGCV
jgi:hypothetical protein